MTGSDPGGVTVSHHTCFSFFLSADRVATTPLTTDTPVAV